MKPTVSRLEKEFEGKVEFKKVNIDKPESQALMRQYRFIGRPQFVVVGGDEKVIASRNGFQSYEALKAEIEKALR